MVSNRDIRLLETTHIVCYSLSVLFIFCSVYKHESQTWRNDNAKLTDHERIEQLKEIFAELRKQDIVKFLEDLET